MEDVSPFLKLFGITAGDFATLSMLVLLITELLKGKLGKLIEGWRTDVVALIVSFLLAAKMFYPQLDIMLAAGFLCWLAPAGVHKLLKRVTNSTNGGNTQ